MKLILLFTAFFLGLTSLFAQKTVPLMDLSGTADEIITVFDWHRQGMVVLRTHTPKQYQVVFFPGAYIPESKQVCDPLVKSKPWKANIDKHIRTNLPLIPNAQAEKGILNRIWSYGFTPKHAFFVEHFQNALYVHIIDTAGTLKSSVITPVPNRPNLKTKVFATNEEVIVVTLLKETGLPEEAYSINDNGEFQKLPDFPTKDSKIITGIVHLDSVTFTPYGKEDHPTHLTACYHIRNEKQVQVVRQGLSGESIDEIITLSLVEKQGVKYLSDKPVFIINNHFNGKTGMTNTIFGIPVLMNGKSQYEVFIVDMLGKTTGNVSLPLDCIDWNKNQIVRISAIPYMDAFRTFINEAIISVFGDKAYYLSFSTYTEKYAIREFENIRVYCTELNPEKPVYETLEINSHRPILGYFFTDSGNTNPYHGFTRVNRTPYKLTPDRKKMLLFQE